MTADSREPAGQAGARGPDRAREASDPADAAGEVGERQVPFFCPYCGEESLWPAGSQPGHWTCGACARNFRLGFLGVRRPSADGPEPAGQASGARPIQPPARAVR